MFIFIGIFVSLLLFVWGNVWFRFVVPLGLPSPWFYGLLIFFALTFLSQILRFFYFRRKNPPYAFILFAYYFMGLFVHLFFAGITKDLLLLVPDLLPHAREMLFSFLGLAFFLNGWGIFTALYGPAVKKVPIKTSSIHGGLQIAQISDLHIGPVIGKGYVKRVVDQCNAENPELIVLTGDIGDGEADKHAEDLAPLGELRAPLGVFYVTGNHEYYWDAPSWVSAMQGLGIKPLLNTGVEIPGKNVWLGGVTDIGAGYFSPADKSDPLRALPPAGSSGLYKILLAHQPKSCFAAEAAGFDLMLSGHTHAGQFFPFNLVVGLFNPFSKGLNQQGKMQVYVNAGTGFWGPPLRLWVRAEISLLVLGNQ